MQVPTCCNKIFTKNSLNAFYIQPVLTCQMHYIFCIYYVSQVVSLLQISKPKFYRHISHLQSMNCTCPTNRSRFKQSNPLIFNDEYKFWTSSVRTSFSIRLRLLPPSDISKYSFSALFSYTPCLYFSNNVRDQFNKHLKHKILQFYIFQSLSFQIGNRDTKFRQLTVVNILS